jgi:hypothetical protein
VNFVDALFGKIIWISSFAFEEKYNMILNNIFQNLDFMKNILVNLFTNKSTRIQCEESRAKRRSDGGQHFSIKN